MRIDVLAIEGSAEASIASPVGVADTARPWESPVVSIEQWDIGA